MSIIKTSIILCTYNEENYIKNTIQELQKTIKNLELIIVDDNSTDKTREIINSLNNNNKINLIHRKKTRGLASAFHAGLIQTTGQYVGWIDTNMSELVLKFNEMDKTFQKMESDLYNLVPVIGTINRVRSNHHFGEIPEEPRDFGECDFEIGEKIVKRKKVKFVEPRENIRGDIARTHLYMTRVYRGEYRMRYAEKQLMEKWNKLDPPDKWECEKAELIELIQGNRNPILFSRCSEFKLGW